MRHRQSKFRINRFTSWRKATLLSLVRSLLKYQSIHTTKTRGRMAKALADKLINLARANTLAGKRQAYKLLGDHKLVSLLFSDIAVRFANTNGGYTRLIHLGPRRGDNAEMVILELTEIKKKEKKHHKKKKESVTEGGHGPEAVKGKPHEPGEEEKKPETKVAVKEKPPITKKPTKNFLGGLRGIFKKERDSL